MRLSGSDLRLLKVFDAVVRHGGFSAAQAALNVSPSTISNHITALEERLGVSLCQRGRSGFKLSEKGKLVFDQTQQLLRHMENFSNGVSILKGQLIGKIKVGLVGAIATDTRSKLDEAFAKFLSVPNDIKFEISQNQPQELLQQVLNGTLDVAIGSFPHKAAGLTYRKLHQEQHSLYCGSRHPLFSKEQQHLTLDSILSEEVVGRGYWRDKHHEELGFKNIKAIVYEIEPQLILIRSGKFIGYLPDHFAASWVAKGQLRCLSPLTPTFNCEFDIVSKKGIKPSRALSKFISDVESTSLQSLD